MWRLSGFGDEIDADLDEQVRVLGRLGIRYLDLRGVWGTNVVRLSDEEVERVRRTLDAAGVGVSAIASPVGKSRIDDDFGPHLDDFRRALDVAHRLESPFVRIFSFYLPQGDDPARHREAVIDRLGQLVRIADGSGVTLVHENEKGIYGDTPARCHDLLAAINSPRLRAVWDPANFVQCGARPHDDGYELLRPFIAYVHVKDAVAGTDRIVVAGEGDGQIGQTLAALAASGFDGFLSLEPHLSLAGPSAGFSGPDLFGQATEALKGLLREQTIAWA